MTTGKTEKKRRGKGHHHRPSSSISFNALQGLSFLSPAKSSPFPSRRKEARGGEEKKSFSPAAAAAAAAAPPLLFCRPPPIEKGTAE